MRSEKSDEIEASGPAFQFDQFRCPSAARIASRPSVSAAGPGCRISADLISMMRSFGTAGIASQPGRCRILSGTTFLPHQEAKMTSGAAAITSCGETIRSLAAFCFLSSGNISLPPAISMSSETQSNAADEWIVPLLEINLWLRSATNRCRHLAKASLIGPGKPFRLVRRSNQSADGADHCENAGDVALIESMDGNAGADQVCRDWRLKIGKGKDEVWLERNDLRNMGRGEGRNARLVAPDVRRPHRITGHADHSPSRGRGAFELKLVQFTL